MDSINNTDFKKLVSRQKTIQMKMRLLALEHFKQGKSRTQIAKDLQVSRTSINKWIRLFLEEGLEGLQEKPRTGRPAFLTKKQQEQLRKFITTEAELSSGKRLIGSDIHDYIIQNFNKHYHPNSVYSLLKRMGFSYITSHPTHSKQSPQIQVD